MKAAYIDTSSLLSIAFSEPAHDWVASRIEACEQVFSANLLEAELRSAASREELPDSIEDFLVGIEWILPCRPLSGEIESALSVGYLRGADLWHVGCALLLATEVAPDPVNFISLDRRQLVVAESLNGLRVDWPPTAAR